MDKISIKRLSLDDADSLFKFEIENRSYFNTIGLSRSDSYYNRDSFQEIIESLVGEQDKDIHYMYLVMNTQGEVIGRVNLTDVIKEPLNKAELGYRIGEKNQGKGFATAAVKLVMKQAYLMHKLHRIEAGTSPQNIGSQIVLIKNGFHFIGKYNQYILKSDGWADSLLFEKVLDLS
ncbi:GNAT family N-acetyltransferase [Lacrimispora sphenoides]|uniref:Ribosomal-protein-alanine N-acetyltransferase n=1 Tax=Lacrimispora sphenoides JCM 1415 TaxID=1297793 RepID=A0ABY1C812_9FIRM|nr:GNAT family protein [Lacrimispora sphenoides]SET78086.1 ribosomal-protein-alanine N-acetyltransferase [[Clostridium] sphenoides JCM 1415]SUY51214.1 GCN5-related N-acetyltransferase [Lacrimispora sphenoides]